MRIEPLGTHQTPIIAPIVSHYDSRSEETVTRPGLIGWSSVDTLSVAPEKAALPAVPPPSNPRDLELVEEQRRLSPTCPYLGLNQYSGFGLRV